MSNLTTADFIKITLLTVGWCVGLYVSSRDPGDLLFFLRKMSENWWIKKPVIHCINCMASIHSFFIMAAYFSWHRWPVTGSGWLWFGLVWLAVTLICSFLNGLALLVYLCLDGLASRLSSREKEDESDLLTWIRKNDYYPSPNQYEENYWYDKEGWRYSTEELKFIHKKLKGEPHESAYGNNN